jgi:uncharacterized protein
VIKDGLRVAGVTGAGPEVITLFGLFHDSRWVHECRDDGRKLRGAEFTHSLRGNLAHLKDSRFDLLEWVCRLHTDGHTERDATLR